MMRSGSLVLGMALGLGMAAGGILAGGPAAAQDGLLPEKRIVQIQDVDFFGSDLRSVFDVSLSACQNACLDERLCKAFTYNRSAQACFLKTGVGEMVEFPGAISARVVETPEPMRLLAETRAAELSFLPRGFMTDAREFAIRVGPRYPLESTSADTLAELASAAQRQGDFYRAFGLRGAIVNLDDAPDNWVLLSRTFSAYQGTSSGETSRLRLDAQSAAINAYLRAESPADRAQALVRIAEAIEARGEGRRSITALRMAYDLDGAAETEQALERAISLYGFHITEHTVEADAAQPRVCVLFSEALVKAGVDYADYVRVEGSSLPVEADESQVCVDGVTHGERVRLTVRAGLPAASGETLLRPATIEVYVRDRTPSVRFPGRAYVLPKGSEPRIPVVTVNLDSVDLRLFRVPDRNLLRIIQDGMFDSQLTSWEQERIEDRLGAAVWEGEGLVERHLNEDWTTTLPIGEAVDGFEPGVYVMTARAPTEAEEDWGGNQVATQWFVVTDLGVATMTGDDGLHVFARSLADSGAAPGATLTLLAANNEVLGEVTADADGYAAFAPGLTRGTGGMRPALLVATTAAGDFTFLDLSGPGFDLSDRGVEGRPAPEPVDVFLTTERGIYRPGEAVHATILARDATADAIGGLPLTAIVKRPDGVEFTRQLLADAGAGGRAYTFATDGGAMRGTWRIDVHADPEMPPLATVPFLVEDFVPERIDFDLDLPEGAVSLDTPPVVALTAEYLYGAPAGNLSLEGTVEIGPADGLEDYPGYRFGPADEYVSINTQWLDSGIATDETGFARFSLPFPEPSSTAKPLQMTATVRVLDGSGRPVERSVTRPVAPPATMIGIRPLFDDVAAEGTEALFDAIAVGPGGERVALDRVVWEVSRVTVDYQWYESGGSWRYEPVTRRARVASGEVTLGTDEPVRIAAPVEWGRYELRLTDTTGAFTTASTTFYAGWYAPQAGTDTPDVLQVGLDRESYTVGDTAQLRIKARDAGKLLVAVVDNRLIDTKVVDVPEGESSIDIEVTEAWGPGAYVTATLVRPMDEAAGRNPARALGLTWASVDPGLRDMQVEFTTPDEVDPRGPMDAVIRIDGLKPGEKAYATIAAVDLGILNLTGFEPPAPDEFYFGQRKLGMELRDVYGRLIDGLTGTPGRIRSGGDGLAAANKAAPPTEKLVAFFSGVIEADAAGIAKATFDIPDFNGTVRLMAVTWTETGVGHASKDVLVRDPIVVSLAAPRFLAPGDETRLLIELAHAKGPSGRLTVDWSGDAVVGVPDQAAPEVVVLGDLEQTRLLVPLRGGRIGDGKVRVHVTTPDGTVLRKELPLGVRALDPEVGRQSRVLLQADGGTLTVGPDTFAGLMAGSGRVTVAAGPFAQFDVPGLLSALNRYPYGCTEQMTSRALPLLYFDQVAVAMGVESPAGVRDKVEGAITRILGNQAATGGFGLWGPSSGDMWLDAYVTDFLGQARDAGYEVPDLAFSQALDNLRNQLSYAGDFEKGGEDIAYALMVLAKQGLASIGDLRYYADARSETFGTPLAKAQLGAALAMYGESRRADEMFRLAARHVREEMRAELRYRYDYGSARRDAAAVLTLASLHGSSAVDRTDLTRILLDPRRGRRYYSTQEQAWTLMAANAMLGDPTVTGIRIDGAGLDGLAVRRFEESRIDATPVVIENTGDTPVEVAVTAYGVPVEPEPAGGNGYSIERLYYTMDGVPVSPDAVAQNTQLVVVLTVRDFGDRQARLMVDDPLPAGFEIDNPSILRSGGTAGMDWIDTIEPTHAEFRTERFLAAVDWYGGGKFSLAYVVRAVSPGKFHHPAALVEDMYHPEFRARTEAGRVEVLGPQR